MAMRTRKAPIKPEQRRDWLRRFEEDGESPPQIADKDHYDIRTVRKQLDLAKAERNTREARTTVLRDAVESHYNDLCRYAERLDSEVLGVLNPAPSPDDDYIAQALRQHLPRSPIWTYLSRRKLLKQTENQGRQKLEGAIEAIVNGQTLLASLAKDGLTGVIPGITAALVFETRLWLGGDTGHTLRHQLAYEPAGEGMVNPRFGLSHLGAMAEAVARKHMPRVGDALHNLESRTKTSNEYLELARTVEETRRLDAKLREELAIIRLRRIVPGRCKYCPL
jgi:hypothetical protein